MATSDGGFSSSVFTIDDKSTSNQNIKKERMLNATSMNASDVHLWEMDFLGIMYDSYMSEKEIQGISAEDLFTECLGFYFPEGLPESYTEMYELNPEADWKKIGSVLFRSFMTQTNNEWLKKNYPTDFSKVDEDNMKYINKKARELWKFWMKEKNFEHPNRKAFHLANHFHKVLTYLYEDLVNKCDKRVKCSDDDDFNKNEKHEKIKGLINEIVSYLDIPTLIALEVDCWEKPFPSFQCNQYFTSHDNNHLVFTFKRYNGEGRMDFKHKIKGRKGPMSFKVKPDLTLCSVTGDTVAGAEKTPEEPFAVFEVFGASTFRTLQKTKKASKDSSLTDHSSDQGLVDEVKSMTIDCDSTSIYYDENVQAEIRKHITSCGPAACTTGSESNKLHAQLVLQLYGALIQKAESITEVEVHSSFRPKANLQIAGFFVLNEYIYLAKINQILKFLSKDHIINQRRKTHGPKVTYAKNLFFDMKLSKHRLAFMALLYHYYCIHDLEKMCRWKEVLDTTGYLDDDVNDEVNACDW